VPVKRRTVLVTVAAVVAGVLIVAFSLFAGMSLAGHPQSRNAMRKILPASVQRVVLGDDAMFPLQDEVLQVLRAYYFKNIGSSQLQDSSISGMLAGLDDPYTTYFSPKDYGTFKEHTEGQYSGVGMVVEMKNGFATVVSTFKGSPAEKGEIRPGDLIIGVNGKTARGMTLDDIVAKIKGPAGSRVAIQTYRYPPGTTTTTISPNGSTQSPETPLHLPENGATRDLTLVRQPITVPVVETEIKQVGAKKVAYIRYNTFSDGSSVELRKAINKAIEKDGVSAVILDLRSNGGGLLGEAVHVASIFIPDGTIVTTQGLHSPKEVFAAEGGAIPKVPVYVLVDGYSASASEIVAGALKDTGRAVLVGEKTFGKGLVQTVEPLTNGGALKLTTAVYLTPKGQDINKKGIEPNVTAPDNPATKADETLDKTLQLIAAAR
jgi:carboxyl-terminal processing protease